MSSDILTSNSPQLYCFKCRRKQPVKEATSGVTKFLSQKLAKEMSRDTWVTRCAVCDRPIRSFKKGEAKGPVETIKREENKAPVSTSSPVSIN